MASRKGLRARTTFQEEALTEEAWQHCTAVPARTKGSSEGKVFERAGKYEKEYQFTLILSRNYPVAISAVKRKEINRSAGAPVC